MPGHSLIIAAVIRNQAAWGGRSHQHLSLSFGDATYSCKSYVIFDKCVQDPTTNRWVDVVRIPLRLRFTEAAFPIQVLSR